MGNKIQLCDSPKKCTIYLFFDKCVNNIFRHKHSTLSVITTWCSVSPDNWGHPISNSMDHLFLSTGRWLFLSLTSPKVMWVIWHHAWWIALSSFVRFDACGSSWRMVLSTSSQKRSIRLSSAKTPAQYYRIAVAHCLV